MSLVLLLLDKASSQFRLKHEQPNFECPEIWLDHLRLESDLPDPLVCLVDVPVAAVSESDTQIVRERSKPLTMHLVRMSCEWDDLKRQSFGWYEALLLLNLIVWYRCQSK